MCENVSLTVQGNLTKQKKQLVSEHNFLIWNWWSQKYQNVAMTIEVQLAKCIAYQWIGKKLEYFKDFCKHKYTEIDDTVIFKNALLYQR